MNDKIYTKKGYPLMVYCEYAKGGRRVRLTTNPKLLNRFGYRVALLVYTNQVAKLFNRAWTRKGKMLMELPYCTADIYNTEESEALYIDRVIHINSKEGYDMKGGKKKTKVDFDIDDIKNAENE